MTSKTQLLYYISLFHLCSLIFFSCERVNSAENAETTNYPIHKNKAVPVEIIIAENSIFHEEIISNGKLKACRKSDIKFTNSGRLIKVNVKNGNFVHAKSTIATIDPFEFQQNYNQSQLNYKKSKLDLENILIGQGYDITDSIHIPKNILATAQIKSGYKDAELVLKNASHALSQTSLKAPFSGLIANLKSKVHEEASSGEPFCTIIDNSQFDIEFYLMESEIDMVRLNDKISMIPYSIEKTYHGVITEINPVINEDGLISLKATVKNDGQLIEGMNAKVIIEKDVPNQIIVPKSAILLRQDQEVLFKYVNGQAYWTYVITTHENSHSFSVIANPDKAAELNSGDTVITSGNMNLAHDSKITLTVHD